MTLSAKTSKSNSNLLLFTALLKLIFSVSALPAPAPEEGNIVAAPPDTFHIAKFGIPAGGETLPPLRTNASVASYSIMLTHGDWKDTVTCSADLHADQLRDQPMQCRGLHPENDQSASVKAVVHQPKGTDARWPADVTSGEAIAVSVTWGRSKTAWLRFNAPLNVKEKNGGKDTWMCAPWKDRPVKWCFTYVPTVTWDEPTQNQAANIATE